MEIQKAQLDMREAYFNGATGVLISGIIWLLAGVIAYFSTQETSLLVFFFGGMFIHPLSIVLDKALKRSGKHQKENPFGQLAMESTLLLFIGLFIAYYVYQINSHWFYPIMLMIIGARYVIFQSIYGLKIYWVLGLILVVTGAACFLFNFQFYLPAVIGGIIELIFCLALFSKKESSES